MTRDSDWPHDRECLYDRNWIAARIPHQGDMCLLDGVVAWSAERVHCRASSHRHKTNPLRHRDRLGALCAIEYAAQAMAVHAALVASVSCAVNGAARPQAGYLTSARAVELRVGRLDDIAADLDIEVERLSGDELSVLYRFSISAEKQLIANGRAAVVLDAVTVMR